eukprot:Colp12_sorted_trinity150504_noHs@4383
MAKPWLKKLQALEYAQGEHFNIENDVAWRSLVIWLEDIKIRHYKIKDRADLKSKKDAEWFSVFFKYLADLGCPFTTSTPFDLPQRQRILNWLLAFAVRLEYSDNAAKYNKGGNATTATVPEVNVNDAHSRGGIKALADTLRVPLVVTSAPAVLKGCAALAQQRLAPPSLASLNECYAKKPPQKDALKLEDVPLGFDEKDPAVARAAKVLRMLHIVELRTLQSNVNDIIVGFQALTANPKTDSSLGKVGI